MLLVDRESAWIHDLSGIDERISHLRTTVIISWKADYFFNDTKSQHGENVVSLWSRIRKVNVNTRSPVCRILMSGALNGRQTALHIAKSELKINSPWCLIVFLVIYFYWFYFLSIRQVGLIHHCVREREKDERNGEVGPKEKIVVMNDSRSLKKK